MRYQNPQLLYALFAIAIPILIHLFNLRKHKKIYFSSIRFLKEIKEDNRKKSKIKNLLILASRILAITFLILAFSKPYISSNTQEKTNDIFIYIDNSFSMDAHGNEGRLLDVAKEKARIINKAYPIESKFYLITNNFLSRHTRSYNSREFGLEIDNIESSSQIRNISEIINRQQTLTKENSHLYLISDMQISTLELEKVEEIDSNLTVFFTPINAHKQPNLTLDSCWINTPVITSEKTIKLFIQLCNYSETEIKEKVVHLNINGKSKSQQFVNLESGEIKIIDFDFTSSLNENIIGEVIIDDSPINFDNKLYFSIKRNKKINISCVNEDIKNTSLNTLFMQDTSLFSYEEMQINNINYNTLIKQDLVILNKVSRLSSGLLKTLNKILTTGSSIIVIPPGNIDIKTYNNLLKELKLNTITTIEEKEVQINNININHLIFNTVFDGKIEKINFPQVNTYFVTNNNKIYTPLLKFENNKNFLSVYNNKKGLIYPFNAPIENDYSNFTKHALFVPTLLNIAIQSVKANNLYNTIGLKDYFTSSYRNQEQVLLHLRNNDLDIIPTVKTVGGETYYYTHNQIKEDGIYNLANSSNNIEAIAFNYNRNESQIKHFKTTEIQNWKKKYNLNNINIVYSSLEKFQNRINQQQKGKEFWKLALALSLLFFALEILLIKLIKL